MAASYANGFAPRDGSPRYPQLTKGIVGSWCPVLGPTGVILRDWGPRMANATLSNMTVSTAWSINDGQYGLTFDGTDDFATTSAYPGVTTDRISVSIWFKAAQVRLQQLVNYGSVVMFVEMTAAGAIRWRVRNTLGGNIVDVTAGTYAANSLDHYLFVMDGSNALLYKNGSNVSAFTTSRGTGTIDNTSGALIFGSVDGTSRFTNGTIKEITIYDRALSATEAVKLYQIGAGGIYELGQRGRRSTVSGNRRRRVICGGAA